MAKFKTIAEEGIDNHIVKEGGDPDRFTRDVKISLDVYGRINRKWLAERHKISWVTAEKWASHIKTKLGLVK